MFVKKNSAIKFSETTQPAKVASKSQEDLKRESLAKDEKSSLLLKTTSKTSNGTATSSPTSVYASSKTDKKSKTQIVVKYDVGFNNHIYLRGKGANLSWDKGILLKNIKHDEWLWETDLPFSEGEFKALINDKQYEAGENRKLLAGMNLLYTPRF